MRGLLNVFLRLSVPSHKVAHVMDLFGLYSGPVSVKPGCRSVALYNHFSNRSELVLFEEWTSRKSLETHLCSEDFRKVLAIMDLASNTPDLKIQKIASTEGFELVAELRKEITNQASEVKEWER